MNAEAALLSPASRSDLPAVLALVRQCELLENGVEEAMESFVVARARDEIVGCAGLEVYGELGLVRSVAVAAQSRNVGLGASLVTGVVAAARGAGLRELFLLTTTAPGFFARLGFVDVPRSEVPAPIAGSWEFRVGCPQSARAMRLSLRG